MDADDASRSADTAVGSAVLNDGHQVDHGDSRLTVARLVLSQRRGQAA